MIAVIADDLSGAAELAGAALRHGLSAEVQTDFFPDTDVDVVCVDTDSRYLSPADAARRVAAVTRRIVASKPAWIFKKCDSVLRGPVLAEARAVADTAGQSRILLVPANPSRGRTISGGTYLVAGQPLNQTFFAQDPTHPRLTADVKALLGDDLAHVTVPDIATANDVRLQAELLDAQTLPVGAVDFFVALLKLRNPSGISGEIYLPGPGKALLVCGSEASWSRRESEARARGIPAFSLPHDISAVTGALKANNAVLIGIGDKPATHDLAPRELTHQLAQSVATILGQSSMERVLLEGGATAAAVIAAFGWTRLRAYQSTDASVGLLRPVAAQAPLLVVKPGSYPWPAAFWP